MSSDDVRKRKISSSSSDSEKKDKDVQINLNSNKENQNPETQNDKRSDNSDDDDAILNQMKGNNNNYTQSRTNNNNNRFEDTDRRRGRGRGRGGYRDRQEGFTRDRGGYRGSKRWGEGGFNRRDRDNDSEFNRDRDRDRDDRGFNRDREFRGGRGNRGRFNDRGRDNYNFNRDRNFDDRRRDFEKRYTRDNDMENSSKFNNENNNFSNPVQDQKKIEEENQQQLFIQQHSKVIRLLQKAFPTMTEKNAAEIYGAYLQNNRQTIFEAMNFFKSYEIKKLTESLSKEIIPEFTNEIEIYEIYDLSYLNESHKKVLDAYKINSKDSNDNDQNNINIDISQIPAEYFYSSESERRRPLQKSPEGMYNYLPIKCKIVHDGNDITHHKEKCIYAHSDNEVNYHSLVYKTQLCNSVNTGKPCTNPFCHKAHDLLKDFRIIYNYTDPNIIELMNHLSKNSDQIIDYEEVLSNSNELNDLNKFDLSTYKINPCKSAQEGMCNKDYHICYNYHELKNPKHGKSKSKNKNKIHDKRRPIDLFRYNNKLCPALFEEDGECKNENFCFFCHREYEYNYHPKNFRKIIPCRREKNQDGVCEFFETCYGVHKKVVKSNSDKIKELQEREDKIKNEIKMYQEKLENYQCMKCCVVPEKHEFVYLEECKHILCVKCFKKCLMKEGGVCGVKKQKGGKCEVVIKKETGKNFKIDFCENNKKSEEGNSESGSTSVKKDKEESKEDEKEDKRGDSGEDRDRRRRVNDSESSEEGDNE